MRALALALFLTVPVAAQDLVTDRPDFTESAVAVPYRSVQIETGVTVARLDLPLGLGATELSGPEALVRWSFVPGAELRVGLPDAGVIWFDDLVRPDGTVEVEGATVDGVSDGSLGAKVELGAVAGWDLALIGEASVPLGDGNFGSTVVSPLAILIAGRDVGALSLGTQAEVRWDRVADAVELAATAVVGTEVAPGVGVFGELFGDLVQDELGLLGHAGVTVAVAPLVQLDLHAAVGLTDAAPDALVGAGVSARF